MMNLSSLCSPSHFQGKEEAHRNYYISFYRVQFDAADFNNDRKKR